jgi:hypothetical protein
MVYHESYCLCSRPDRLLWPTLKIHPTTAPGRPSAFNEQLDVCIYIQLAAAGLGDSNSFKKSCDALKGGKQGEVGLSTYAVSHKADRPPVNRLLSKTRLQDGWSRVGLLFHTVGKRRR